MLCRRCGRARETKTTKALGALKETGLPAGCLVAEGDHDAEGDGDAKQGLEVV